MLKYIDHTKPTEGQGDASEKGLGFTLMHEGQPITFSSRALTPAETNYSQIEKELLAQIFGLERNHQYTYGRKITLWTDHKPLVSITRKPITTAPKRLQRLLLRLVQYDVEILYKPGKEMYLADTLSRAFLPKTDRSQVELDTESINMVDFLPVSKATLEELQKSTEQDSTSKALKALIINGWPSVKNKLSQNTEPYFNFRDELSVQNGVIFKGTRCVIPISMRNSIKDKLHNSHTGVSKALSVEHVTLFCQE